MTRYRAIDLVGALLAAAVLAGCETDHKLPLLSPIEQARTYGYSETPRGADAYEVTFLAPSQRSTRFRPELDADANAARTRATDMALWRAAGLAEQRGFKGFHVGQVRSNVEIYREPYYDDPFYGPPWWGPGFGPWGHRFGYPWPPYYGAGAYTNIQPRVSIDVELRNALAAGDYNAADVVAELRRALSAGGRRDRPVAMMRMQNGPRGARAVRSRLVSSRLGFG